MKWGTSTCVMVAMVPVRVGRSGTVGAVGGRGVMSGSTVHGGGGIRSSFGGFVLKYDRNEYSYTEDETLVAVAWTPHRQDHDILASINYFLNWPYKTTVLNAVS